MELSVFNDQKKSELSLIEVAHEILKSNSKEMPFKELYGEVSNYLDMDKRARTNAIVDFYTDLNIDGSFISLGNDIWGLRDWYPFESVDEETNHNEDIKEMGDRPLDSYEDDEEDDDIIDYIDPDDDEENDDSSDSFVKNLDDSALGDGDYLDDEENVVDADDKSIEEDLSPFADEEDDDEEDDE